MDEAKATKSERNRRKKEAAKMKKQNKGEEERALQKAIALTNMEMEEVEAQNKIAKVEASKNRKLFEIKEAPGKGQGMFATKYIHYGTLIFVEWPLLIHAPWLVRTTRDTMIQRDHKVEFDKFWALPKAKCTCDTPPCTCDDHGYERVLFENHFAHFSGKAVYEFASKINHSCDLNTRWSPLEAPPQPDMLMILCFVAVQPIKKGEEITVQYEMVIGKTVTRRAAIRDSRRFECICKACVNNADIPFAAFFKINFSGQLGNKCKDTEILGKPSNERIWLEQNLEHWNAGYQIFVNVLARNERNEYAELLKAGVPKEEICDKRMVMFKRARLEWLMEHNPFDLPEDFLVGHLKEVAEVYHLHLMTELEALNSGKVTQLFDSEPEKGLGHDLDATMELIEVD